MEVKKLPVFKKNGIVLHWGDDGPPGHTVSWEGGRQFVLGSVELCTRNSRRHRSTLNTQSDSTSISELRSGFGAELSRD